MDPDYYLKLFANFFSLSMNLFFFFAQILDQLASVLSSQHLARSTAAETKTVGLSTSQKTLPLLSSRPEWRPKSVKVQREFQLSLN